ATSFRPQPRLRASCAARLAFTEAIPEVDAGYRHGSVDEVAGGKWAPGRATRDENVLLRAGSTGSNSSGTARGGLSACGGQSRAHAIAIGNAYFQHTTELGYVHVALAAGDHKSAVFTEIAAPLDDLLVSPGGLVLANLLVRNAIHVGAQVDAGLVRTLVDER